MDYIDGSVAVTKICSSVFITDMRKIYTQFLFPFVTEESCMNWSLAFDKNSLKIFSKGFQNLSRKSIFTIGLKIHVTGMCHVIVIGALLSHFG